MERLRGDGTAYPTACFTCPARTYLGGEYYCDPSKLDDPSIILKVARYRPDKCPLNAQPEESQASATILLRKMLRK